MLLFRQVRTVGARVSRDFRLIQLLRRIERRLPGEAEPSVGGLLEFTQVVGHRRITQSLLAREALDQSRLTWDAPGKHIGRPAIEKELVGKEILWNLPERRDIIACLRPQSRLYGEVPPRGKASDFAFPVHDERKRWGLHAADRPGARYAVRLQVSRVG